MRKQRRVVRRKRRAAQVVPLAVMLVLSRRKLKARKKLPKPVHKDAAHRQRRAAVVGVLAASK